MGDSWVAAGRMVARRAWSGCHVEKSSVIFAGFMGKSGLTTEIHGTSRNEKGRSSSTGVRGAHHHGHLESVIYVVQGRARMRWGEKLEFVAEAGPGDFIYVPPFVPHQEINADPDNPLQCVLVRSDNEAVVVNITDVDPVEKPEEVYWVDPIHKHPHG